MTHKLTVSFERGSGADRLSARIRRIANADGIVTDDCAIDLRLLDERPRTIEAEAGKYYIEACWRDGSTTRQLCSVGSSGVSEVLLRVPKKRRRIQSAVRDFSQPSAGGMFRKSSRSQSSGPPYKVLSLDEGSSTWTALCTRSEIRTKAGLLSDARPPDRGKDLPVQHIEKGDRNWLVYWAADGWFLSSLPIHGGETGHALLRSGPDGLPFVAVEEPEMGMMADMLAIGDAEAARRYAAATYADYSSEEPDGRSIKSPLAICAFAYAVRDDFSDHSWVSSLEPMVGLSQRFPDVSVILWWHALVTAQSDQGWTIAGELFEQAVKSGVPYYSLGIRLLAEGLTMLAAEKAAHEQSAKLVRSLAARTVPSETFTTVKL